MSRFLDGSWATIPPMVDPGTPGHMTPQRLADTGATETVTSRKLVKNKLHVILVGAAAVRVRFSGSPLTAGTAVDATRDVVLGAGTAYPFLAIEAKDDDGNVVYGSVYVAVEAADGAAAYECHVVQAGM